MYNKKSRREHRTRQLRFETLEDRRVLAAVTVGTISDVFDVAANIEIPELIASGGAGADGKISLREAIIASNNTLGPEEFKGTFYFFAISSMSPFTSPMGPT